MSENTKEKEIIYINRGWIGINPKVSEFLKQYENTTMVGFGWALFWRVYLVILAVAIGLAVISEMFS